MDETPVPDAGTLEAVHDSVLQLVARLPRLPSALRVVAGGVTIEAEWATVVPAGGLEGGALSASTNGAGAGAAGLTAADDDEVPDDRAYVRSPTVGSFYRASKPGAPPFVEVGARVVAGQQVAVVESMKLFFAVKAEVDCTIVEVLKDDGAAVEHDEALFAVEPAEVAEPPTEVG
jgi:acetyl-CoA carboxylase biotin carboxyl carrier protein